MIADRDDHLRKAEEINTRIMGIAANLGLRPEELAELTPDAAPRLPPENKRSVGTMSAAMLDILFKASRGYTRIELRDELRNQNERFAEQLDQNMNSFYNNLSRYMKKGKIVERGELLYHPSRAPVEDSPQLSLPENVTRLQAKGGEDGE